MKKALASLIIVVLLVSIGYAAFGAELEDFSGTWEATHLVYEGAEILASLVGLDMELEINGEAVSMTSVAMETDHEMLIFTYENGMMKMVNDGNETQIVYNDDGTITMNMNMVDSESFGIKLKRVNEGTSDLDDTKGTVEEEAPESTGGGRKNYETLSRGSKGEDVQKLQERLIELNWLDGKADGDYGPRTETAVKDFQEAMGLDETGIADSMTQRMLYANNAKKQKIYRKLDYKTLSRDPDLYIGEFYEFNGEVVQVLENGNQVQMRVATKQWYDDVVLVTYTRDSGESRILEDDKVIIRAEYEGLQSYESIFGETITLPLFAAEKVKVK